MLEPTWSLCWSQHEAYVGEVEIAKPEKFQALGSSRLPPLNWPNIYIFLPRADFSKNPAQKTQSAGAAEWSHGPQQKPWEPCACFPDYGRRLTPSKKIQKIQLGQASVLGVLGANLGVMGA